MSKDKSNKDNRGQGAGDPAAGAQEGKELAGGVSEAGAAKATPPQTTTKPNPDPEEDKRWRAARRRAAVMSMSHTFAGAILQNPKIDIFLYGSPFDAGARGEHPNAGTLLAQGAKRLAEDYLNAFDAAHLPPAPAPLPEPETEAGHPTNDFPLD